MKHNYQRVYSLFSIAGMGSYLPALAGTRCHTSFTHIQQVATKASCVFTVAGAATLTTVSTYASSVTGEGVTSTCPRALTISKLPHFRFVEGQPIFQFSPRHMFDSRFI